MKFKSGLKNRVYGLLLDISPTGARVFVDNELPIDAAGLNIAFAITYEQINAECAIIWSQEASGGWIYGLHLTRDAVREMFITDEVKALKEKK
ncbi:MAG TPA: PilZ domain-containing protein [Planococcus sp. (in: firmicutes)]|nr:PilZ domain-containing protein [Planococcus sp. (in: firmicutes)]